MSTPFSKITKTFTEVTAKTTATSFPVLLFNKALIDYGITRIVRFAGNGKVYVYTKDKDLAQTATVTDHVTLTDPTNDRDWNDSTYTKYTLTAGQTETALRTYDFGSVDTRFVYLAVGSSGYEDNKFYYSTDGTSWTLFTNGRGFNRIFKLTFRYIRWSAANTNTSVGTGCYLNSIEVFSPNNYTYRFDTGPAKISGYIDMVWIILDGSGRVPYYVYDLDEVKVSVSEGEVSL